MKIDKLIKEVDGKKNKAEEYLADKKLEIGFADSPIESRYISATRWDLEHAIIMAVKEVNRLDGLLRELKQIKKLKKGQERTVAVGSLVTMNLNGKIKDFILSFDSEDMILGVLSIKSTLGQRISGKKAGFKEEHLEIIKIS